MGLVYLYLVAWVAGGVLLGARMLLSQPKDPLQLEAADGARRPYAGLGVQLAALGLIGFGLGGLAAEGLGLLRSPWTEACAVASALLVGALGYLTVQTNRG